MREGLGDAWLTWALSGPARPGQLGGEVGHCLGRVKGRSTGQDPRTVKELCPEVRHYQKLAKSS